MLNKTVFITGASRGIGLSIAQSFARKGYYVIGTSRSKFDLANALETDNCLHMILDVTDRPAITQAHDTLKLNNNLPSVIVNNAGITKDQLFLRMKNEDWDNVINTNLSSVFNITKVFVKSMVKAREGRVINISSVAGLMGNPGQVNYSSSKAAIGGFTKSLAKELASRNITVNSIAPGFISSDMTDTLSDDQKSEILKQIPMQKFGDAKNIADLAVFLASDEGEYITGQTISVDGGLY
ncbi:3-oxoacyl-[acyl-carrier-protein] reductase [Gammaproteobacteria bacterium]|jgi:3-oxoacyl-[acyl-carrier protein] reductase|nr:3-oxoacyl-[acyl-carrier-protein] reductase [Gammaproteobacteria bacterium]|tara:strand:+ start:5951 stop:6667 length:717 start_codon:yes stop_codon:yes gene_type:complete